MLVLPAAGFAFGDKKHRRMTPAATLQEEMWRREQTRREALMSSPAELEPPLVALAMSLARLAARIDVERKRGEGRHDV